ncbi:D-alanyl-D-alanine carboxypeptidase/D-alanyl-D-alanine-endopeptidase [Virgibacillus sp. MSP4-1]|uniref:D-alanyl-D-alanine carboxypeptidase/D-alanyl-D-alanine endopeptidase n=1 Tax=Virgibacillus sp. MSP4-1 TaxID=2700081 RepID=UPI0003A790E6|nr:D-alanyl-D-alanine carboxypeptidase/D-alanyl-D-alanine-endopeptidase [Virgibacillus sp. MSP4-1]QHS22449.1 D-alanyl-D-alanine carboxypeptidase/D-alanyl-D-alanine-endopeptidase [Virgibacillus sp. MSP4-1]
MNKHTLRFIFLVLVLVLTLIGNRSATSLEAQTDSFSRQIQQLMQNEPHLEGAIAGISIRHAKTGKLLYQHNGSKLLRPASNLKLLTAASALSILGPEYRFSTEVLTNGQVKSGVLKGNLYIRGKGDPTLMEKDLANFAEQLKAKGIHKIEGKLIGDDTWYDEKRYSQDLPWTDEDTYYGAQVSALSISPDRDYDAGTMIANIAPANQAGRKAKITLSPETNYVSINNQLETVPAKEGKDIEVNRKHGTNDVTISGQIPIGSAIEKEWIAVWDPAKYAMRLFKKNLKDQGITVSESAKGKTPSSAQTLLTKKSIPLSELFIPFMKLSNNGHAEILIKELGRVKTGEGSWKKGLGIMKKNLQKYHIDTNSMVLRDGSGLSHINLVTPNQISKLLFRIQEESWFSLYKNSLPIAGSDDRMEGGTLRYRMKRPPLLGQVQAKTGTISTVSSLSGYADTINGKTVTFSILLNNMKNEEYGKSIEDQIVGFIARLL